MPQPILTGSKLLQDPELIEIVQLRTMQHRLAIAARESVSEDVSDALVESGEASVVGKLLENEGARLSKKAVAFLVEESKRVESYRQPLLSREELSPELAGRMYRWVSAALRKHILENFDVDQQALDASIDDTLDSLMSEIRARARKGNRPVVLAEVLAHANAVSPEFLIELLREGQVSLFEGVFAELTGLSLKAARRFIYQPGGEAFAVACKGARVPKSQFASIFVLSRRARPGDKSVNSGEVPRALSVFDRVPQDVAEAILLRWRYDPEYLSLIKAFPLEQFDTLESPPVRRAS